MQGFLVSVDYAGAMNYFTLPLYLKFECKIVFLYIVKREDLFCYLFGEGCLLIVKMFYYGVLKIINKKNKFPLILSCDRGECKGNNKILQTAQVFVGLCVYGRHEAPQGLS